AGKAFTSQLGMSTDRTLGGLEAQFGVRYLDFGFGQRVRRIRLRISSGTRGPACRGLEREIGTGEVRVRCLLKIQVTLPLPTGVNFHGMIPDRANCSKARDRRPFGSDGSYESNSSIVPIHHPCVLHRPPAESFDTELDRRSDRTRQRSHFEALSDFDTVLGDRLIIDHCDDVMNTAVVFRNRKSRVETAL